MKLFRFFNLFVGFGFLLMILGCGVERHSLAPTNVVQVQALNGTINFVDCNEVRRLRIVSAINEIVVHTVKRPQKFLGCLKEALLTNPLHKNGTYGFAELLQESIAEDMPTKVICKQLDSQNGATTVVNAQAGVGLSREELTVDHDLIDDSSIARIAAVILHELFHNKGYTHYSGAEYSRSTNEQVETCLQQLIVNPRATPIPNVNPLSSHSREVELHPAGGGKGKSFSLWCAQDEVMVGQKLQARIDGSLGGIRIFCRPPYASSNATTTRHVGSVPTSFTSMCGDTRVVVGVEGHAKNNVNRLRFLCANLTNILNGSPVSFQQRLRNVGTTSGVSFQRLCPLGMVVRGLRGQFNNEGIPQIHQVRVVCGRLWVPFSAKVDIGRPKRGVALKGTVGTSVRREMFVCNNQGVLYGLYGRSTCIDATAADGTVTRTCSNAIRLGGLCHGFGGHRVGQNFLTSGVGHFHNDSVPIKPPAGQKVVTVPYVESCPIGNALVGFQANLDSFGSVGFLQGLCANTGAWRILSSGTSSFVVPTYTLPILGCDLATCPPGFARIHTCSRGFFLAGMEVHSGAVSRAGGRRIHQLKPICRRYDTTPWTTPSLCRFLDDTWVCH